MRMHFNRWLVGINHSQRVQQKRSTYPNHFEEDFEGSFQETLRAHEGARLQGLEA